jgi:hypothetical protein
VGQPPTPYRISNRDTCMLAANFKCIISLQGAKGAKGEANRAEHATAAASEHHTCLAHNSCRLTLGRTNCRERETESVKWAINDSAPHACQNPAPCGGDAQNTTQRMHTQASSVGLQTLPSGEWGGGQRGSGTTRHRQEHTNTRAARAIIGAERLAACPVSGRRSLNTRPSRLHRCRCARARRGP